MYLRLQTQSKPVPLIFLTCRLKNRPSPCSQRASEPHCVRDIKIRACACLLQGLFGKTTHAEGKHPSGIQTAQMMGEKHSTSFPFLHHLFCFSFTYTEAESCLVHTQLRVFPLVVPKL